jgi:N-acetylneuraminic acid mutarotase
MNIKHNEIALIILALGIIFSCQKEYETYPYKYPYLILREISNINSEGVTATAEILSLGNDSIIDFGFVWCPIGGVPTIDRFKLSFTGKPHVGIFSGEIKNCINENVLYDIRPFIQGKKYLVYGTSLQFKGLGSLDPKIIDFTPKEGKRKSQVKIIGENFNSNPIVYFGNANAKVIKAYTNEIVVEVPLLLGNVKIYLHQNDKIFESDQTYNILNPWTEISLPDELLSLEYPTCFAINGRGYFVCGYSSITSTFSKKMWEYNPINNEWMEKSEFPGAARKNAVSTVINNKAYIGFGDNGRRSKGFSDLWEYDPSSDTWSRKEDFPLQEYGEPVSFSNNNKGYIGLGTEQYSYGDGGKLSSKFWSFDVVANKWEQISDFPYFAFSCTAFSVNNSLYAGLGWLGDCYSNFYELDTLKNSWTNNLTYPGKGCLGIKNFVIGDKVYMGLGNDNNNSFTDFWEFNHTNKTWTRQLDFPYSTVLMASFSINGKGYVFGSKYGYLSYIRSFWEFDPEKN